RWVGELPWCAVPYPIVGTDAVGSEKGNAHLGGSGGRLGLRRLPGIGGDVPPCDRLTARRARAAEAGRGVSKMHWRGPRRSRVIALGMRHRFLLEGSSRARANSR